MRSATVPIKGGKLPAIQTIEAWDGKDGQVNQKKLMDLMAQFLMHTQLPVEEDDIDLSDVELDDEPPKDEL